MNEVFVRATCDTFHNSRTSNLRIEGLKDISTQTVDLLNEVKDKFPLLNITVSCWESHDWNDSKEFMERTEYHSMISSVHLFPSKLEEPDISLFPNLTKMTLFYNQLERTSSQHPLQFSPHDKLKKLDISLYTPLEGPLDIDLHKLTNLRSFRFYGRADQLSLNGLPTSLERLSIIATGKTYMCPLNLPTNLKILNVNGFLGQKFPEIVN
ncbi:unnamed protein product [Ambrosiozyma monospora]|uniref:Unnamed protein product n=1 Tax=Ambrosiozyma monospora TaxID=43982 RepID=A0ACB5SRP7_AMBMO|nr:unnamed protein product [Ambrosiozyma monospora]